VERYRKFILAPNGGGYTGIFKYFLGFLDVVAPNPHVETAVSFFVARGVPTEISS